MLHSYQLTPGLIIPFIFGLESCSDTVRKASERPNILVIMTDQQSASMMSCTGNSVLPLIEQNKNARWPKSILLETGAGYMIHTGRYKYELDDIGRIREMFIDLQADPDETVNLINRIEYKPVIDSLRSELINHLTGAGVQITVPVSE